MAERAGACWQNGLTETRRGPPRYQGNASAIIQRYLRMGLTEASC